MLYVLPVPTTLGAPALFWAPLQISINKHTARKEHRANQTNKDQLGNLEEGLCEEMEGHTSAHPSVWSAFVQGQEKHLPQESIIHAIVFSCQYFGILFNPRSSYFAYPTVKKFSYAVSKSTEVKNTTADKDHRNSLGC